MKKTLATLFLTSVLLAGCNDKLTPVSKKALTPKVITEQAVHDTDDPAIWINPQDKSKSLIIGTDKEDGGGLYAYTFDGKIVASFLAMQRPNNVDIAYDFPYQGQSIAIAVVTERNTNQIRVFKLPELTPIDQGGLKVFEGETKKNHNAPMGIALYVDKTESTPQFYAIVGRKDGPSSGYLWQYHLTAQGENLQANVVRKFGNYSGNKEIEAIVVDNELGYVYYSDETAGVRKYYASPKGGVQELAFFAQKDVKRDHEGLAIYKKNDSTGYLVLSDQQNNALAIYAREGSATGKHDHQRLATIPISAIECDGLEITSLPINEQFPEGALVTMSNGKVFHIYSWTDIQKQILKK